MLGNAFKWAQGRMAQLAKEQQQRASTVVQPDAPAQSRDENTSAQQVTALTSANLKKQEQVANVARQQSLQAQRKADAAQQNGAVQQNAPAPVSQPPAATLTGSPDGAAVWAPKSGLKQENLIWPPPKRRKVGNTPITSPQQKNSSQSRPNVAATLSTPKLHHGIPVPAKENMLESPKPAEVFRCPIPKCE
ncbi:MAG: hypothetical protein JWP29_5489, partial [Rhodoferax sp.]|nr:hypothetical protein [Rhodoferax sp.]